MDQKHDMAMGQIPGIVNPKIACELMVISPKKTEIDTNSISCDPPPYLYGPFPNQFAPGNSSDLRRGPCEASVNLAPQDVEQVRRRRDVPGATR